MHNSSCSDDGLGISLGGNLPFSKFCLHVLELQCIRHGRSKLSAAEALKMSDSEVMEVLSEVHMGRATRRQELVTRFSLHVDVEQLRRQVAGNHHNKCDSNSDAACFTGSAENPREENLDGSPGATAVHTDSEMVTTAAGTNNAGSIEQRQLRGRVLSAFPWMRGRCTDDAWPAGDSRGGRKDGGSIVGSRWHGDVEVPMPGGDSDGEGKEKQGGGGNGRAVNEGVRQRHELSGYDNLPLVDKAVGPLSLSSTL